jgi:hypothetical protein
VTELIDALVLDVSLIDRLVAALRQQGVPMVDHLNPGLSEREMAALVAPLEITLPQEAMAWWGYADGVPLDSPANANLSPSWSWRPLAETVELCREMRRIGNQDLDEPKAFLDFWLPVVRGDGMLVMDTSHVTLAPVYCINWHTFDSDDPPTPKLPSLGALIASWTVVFERRALWFDEAQQLLTGNGQLLDELGVDWELV